MKSRKSLKNKPFVAPRRFPTFGGGIRIWSIDLLAIVAALLFLAPSAHAAAPEENAYASIAQLARVLVQIENRYVDAVDRSRLVDGAIRGMVAELDPHSVYWTQSEYEAFKSEQKGEFAGVGVELDARGGGLIVIATIPGAPAERAGVKRGDRIVRVNSTDVSGGMPVDKLAKKMRGRAGTPVKLAVIRDGKPLVFDLVREIVHLTSVTSKMLDGGVGYIRIKQFLSTTHAEFVAAVKSLMKANGGPLKRIVLDLRGNPGGLVFESSEVADEFLDAGDIFSTRHRGVVNEKVSARRGGLLTGARVVVIVDAWSASAAELLAAALQDNDRATVVGEITYGKGTVQATYELPNGAAVKLTTARYYTPSGFPIHGRGITPDVAVEVPRTGLVPTHEADTEGHLVVEPQADAGAPKARPKIAVPKRQGDIEPMLHISEIPANPASSNDAALRIAYAIALGK